VSVCLSFSLIEKKERLFSPSYLPNRERKSGGKERGERESSLSFFSLREKERRRRQREEGEKKREKRERREKSQLFLHRLTLWWRTSADFSRRLCRFSSARGNFRVATLSLLILVLPIYFPTKNFLRKKICFLRVP